MLIALVEVPDVRGIKVHCLLHQSKPEDLGIKVNILLGIPSNSGDVVDSVGIYAHSLLHSVK